jgi:hypothetical protein
MKKLVIATIAAASMVFASSAFALQAMDASSMKDTTGQGGVAIAVNNVVLETITENTYYIDNTGNAGNGAGSALVISGQHTIKHINSIATDPGNAGTVIAGYTFAKHPLTIDIGACDLLAGKTGVIIGLPTLQIVTYELVGKKIGFADSVGGTIDEMIEIKCDKKTLNILGGKVEIAASYY